MEELYFLQTLNVLLEREYEFSSNKKKGDKTKFYRIEGVASTLGTPDPILKMNNHFYNHKFHVFSVQK